MRVSWRTVRRLWQGWLVLLALTLAIGATVTAEAGWPSPDSQAASVAPAIMIQPVSAGPAPTSAGMTGTAALPPLPITATAAEALAAAEPGVVAAQPFTMARASVADRSRALQCLADAIYYEAASEPDAGQRAVAQVVLNRVRHPAFPATVCGVVYQGSERGGCQFSFACDGAMARVPSAAGWTRAARVAAAALAGYVYAPVGLATHYHTFAVTPAWNRALVMTDVVGAHFFHRWKGYWGTAAAFSQIYAGGEPLPGPHALLTTPVAPATMAEAGVVLPLAPSVVGSATLVVTTASPVVAQTDHLPPASPVLDKWKDSGKPLPASGL